MGLDRESASQFEHRFRDAISGTGSLGKPCPVSSLNSGTQFPSEVPWGKSDPEFAWIAGRTFRGLFHRNFEEWLYAALQRRKSATLVQHASVAQGIEHRSPKAGVDGSNPPGGTREQTSPVPPRCRALLVLRAGFGPSTPASPISPRGEFSNPPGGTRDLPIPVPQRRYALLVLESSSSVP